MVCDVLIKCTKTTSRVYFISILMITIHFSLFNSDELRIGMT